MFMHFMSDLRYKYWNITMPITIPRTTPWLFGATLVIFAATLLLFGARFDAGKLVGANQQIQ
jgi:hypothetical protein